MTQLYALVNNFFLFFFYTTKCGPGTQITILYLETKIRDKDGDRDRGKDNMFCLQLVSASPSNIPSDSLPPPLNPRDPPTSLPLHVLRPGSNSCHTSRLASVTSSPSSLLLPRTTKSRPLKLHVWLNSSRDSALQNFFRQRKPEKVFTSLTSCDKTKPYSYWTWLIWWQSRCGKSMIVFCNKTWCFLSCKERSSRNRIKALDLDMSALVHCKDSNTLRGKTQLQHVPSESLWIQDVVLYILICAFLCVWDTIWFILAAPVIYFLHNMKMKLQIPETFHSKLHYEYMKTVCKQTLS